MRVVLARKISPRNINLAYVEGTKVKSDDVVQIRDLSTQYTENQLPIFTEARRCIPESDGDLDIINDTLDVRITSEYNYIKDEAAFIPLWHRYKLKNMYYNNTAYMKSSRHTLNTDSNREYQYISTKTTSIVVPNTIKVEHKPGASWVLMSPDTYLIDNGKKIIKFTPTAHTSYLGDDIRISYYIINFAITLYDEVGNEIDIRHYRIEPNKYETTPDAVDRFQESDTDFLNHIYETSILIANVLGDDTTYFVEYTYYDVDSNLTSTKIEVINTEDLYTKVQQLETYHTKDSYFYTVNESTFKIGTKLTDDWPLVFVKYPTDRNSNIAVIEPKNKPHDTPWFIEISNDKLTRTIDGGTYTYEPIEKLSQNVVNDSYIVKSTREEIIKISEDIVKVNFNNMSLIFDNDGIITNIKMYNSGTDITDLIQWVDGKRGMIKLSRSINISQEDNYIEYQYKIFNIQYKEANINPYMVFNATNNSLIDKFIIFFMLPIEELNTSKGRSVFHSVVYKHPERYEGVEEHEKSIDAMIEYLTTNREGVGSIELFVQPPSGTTIYIGSEGESYTEGANLFTEGDSWEIGSGVVDTAISLSDAIDGSTLDVYDTEDISNADVASGEITVYGAAGNQEIRPIAGLQSGTVSGMTVIDITGSRSNLYDIIEDYIPDSVPDETDLHPIILGYAGSTNITTPQSLKITDIRRRGGGLSVNTEVNELNADKVRHYLDIAKIDGYEYDLSNVAIVTIKTSVKERLKLLMQKYDTYAQRQLRDNSEFDIDTYAESYIRTISKKYLNAGCSFTVQYID